MRALRAFSISVFLLSLFTGCAVFGESVYVPHKISARDVPRTINAVTRNLISNFQYEKIPISWRIESDLSDPPARFQEYIISFPSIGYNAQKNNRIWLRYFKSRSLGKKKFVIVLRIPGGPSTDGFPSSIMAAHLIGWGNLPRPRFVPEQADDTNVIIVENINDVYDWGRLETAKTDEDLKAEARLAANTLRVHIFDVFRLLDVVSEWKEIDSSRIGIVGFSTSAAIALMAMSVDSRISAGVFVAPIARIDKVVGHGTKEVVISAQGVAKKNLGLGKEELTKELESIFVPIEPLHYAPNLNPARVFLVDAKYDEYVVDDVREELARALGYPERLTYSLGHTRATAIGVSLLGGGKICRLAEQFFDKKL